MVPPVLMIATALPGPRWSRALTTISGGSVTGAEGEAAGCGAAAGTPGDGGDDAKDIRARTLFFRAPGRFKYWPRKQLY
jgi:hypothetical protein